MSDSPSLSNDAAMVVGLAGTALPFAESPAAEAERWLRVLREHGETAAWLRELGVSEGPVEAAAAAGAGAPAERDPVTAVTERAAGHARERGAGTVETADLLLGVMDVYGPDFDRVLEAHGVRRDSVLGRVRAETGAG